jgi:hypothetical protein
MTLARGVKNYFSMPKCSSVAERHDVKNKYSLAAAQEPELATNMLLLLLLTNNTERKPKPEHGPTAIQN